MDTESSLEMFSEIDSQKPDSVTIRLEGKLSHSDVTRFRSEIDRLVSCGYRQIDVDLSGLEYIDSGGLSEFIPAFMAVREHSGNLRLSNPRRLIRHILVSARLDDVLEIGPPREGRE